MKINGRNFTFLQQPKTIYCFNIGLNNNATYLALNYCLYNPSPISSGMANKTYFKNRKYIF